MLPEGRTGDEPKEPDIQALQHINPERTPRGPLAIIIADGPLECGGWNTGRERFGEGFWPYSHIQVPRTAVRLELPVRIRVAAANREDLHQPQVHTAGLPRRPPATGSNAFPVCPQPGAAQRSTSELVAAGPPPSPGRPQLGVSPFPPRPALRPSTLTRPAGDQGARTRVGSESRRRAGAPLGSAEDTRRGDARSTSTARSHSAKITARLAPAHSAPRTASLALLASVQSVLNVRVADGPGPHHATLTYLVQRGSTRSTAGPGSGQPSDSGRHVPPA
jgi:hypothetical protein